MKDLEVAFGVYGAVLSVIIKPDLHRYAVRHAFIAFEEPEAAQLAVQENDAHVIDEWGLPFKLHLEWAKSDGKKRGRKGARRADGIVAGDRHCAGTSSETSGTTLAWFHHSGVSRALSTREVT